MQHKRAAYPSCKKLEHIHKTDCRQMYRLHAAWYLEKLKQGNINKQHCKIQQTLRNHEVRIVVIKNPPILGAVANIIHLNQTYARTKKNSIPEKKQR